MSEPVLSVRGLERTYVTEAGSLPVLKGVDLDVRPGEIVGLKLAPARLEGEQLHRRTALIGLPVGIAPIRCRDNGGIIRGILCCRRGHAPRRDHRENGQ